MFSDVYLEKKVLITGHTGFKGAWLSQWLLKLGANVVGVSKDIPTSPSLFEVISLEDRISHYIGDVRDLTFMKHVVQSEKPDFIFHLAAQAIVSVSYSEPAETISTNVLGTMNVLESVRDFDGKCIVVMITSDKCYENVEWLWGYKETDQLGGKDIYSGSKGAAELVIHSYIQSFFNDNDEVRIGIGRAGNVIGGGDWAADRVVVDAVKAWSAGRPVDIRCPDATRPWQHVLEPLSGYLCLGQSLWESSEVNHEAFNFGPNSSETHKVTDLLESMHVEWFEPQSGAVQPFQITGSVPFNEAGLLKLNCDKAHYYLGWTSTLSYERTVEMIVHWYKAFYNARTSMRDLTDEQIRQYEKSYETKRI